MPGDDQGNSDPLPYTQVDRAVKPKATLLARMIGESPQHALGSLVEFWDLIGDPRELEKLLREGKREVVLPKEVVVERFEAASGHAIEPAKLVGLGLLERRGEDQFRVRGMSRYFQPIERRLRARAAAVAGGKARAASGRGTDGRFHPVTGAGPAAGPAAGVPAGESAGLPAGEPLDLRLDTAPAAHHPSTTTADSGQRTAAASKKGSAPASRAPDPRHAPLVQQLCATYERITRAPYPFAANGGRNAKAVTKLLASATPPVLDAAWARALQTNGYPTVRTLWELADNLPHFVGTQRGNATPAKGAAWTQGPDGSDDGFLAGLEGSGS